MPSRVHCSLIFLALLFTFLFTAVAASSEAQLLELTESQQRTWARVFEEHQGNKLIIQFSENFRPQPLAISGVTVIPMTGEGPLENRAVIVRNGRFAEIGETGKVQVPQDANAINGAGRYMIPGLTEAHSHTQISLSQFLVYLTRGVTTLREMDGFPWMLDARDKAASNQLLIPNLYVAGHIISYRAWPFYMTQVDTPEQVREVVTAQAAAGFDFIKIHNSLPEPLFSATFEVAAETGLDVIGHIPNEITIAHAIELGMRTNEHFKGYIFDQTLQITDQDYVSATTGSDLWNAPSFSNYHEHLRGEEAIALAREEDSLRLVPRWMRNAWLEQAAQPADKLTELRQTIYPKSRKIFAALWPVTDKFIAGTDTGGYAFMVPGYALQEEVRIFESLGLSPYQALKTATVNPAIAFGKEEEFGTIEPGKRGDFVILNSNPLESTANLSDIWGVSVRGVWLHRDALEWIEESLENAFGEENPAPSPSLEAFENLVSEMETLKEKGFPYPDYTLEEIEILFEELGLDEQAARVEALQRVQGTPIQTP